MKPDLAGPDDHHSHRSRPSCLTPERLLSRPEDAWTTQVSFDSTTLGTSFSQETVLPGVTEHQPAYNLDRWRNPYIRLRAGGPRPKGRAGGDPGPASGANL
jgi:hypothetical protein